MLGRSWWSRLSSTQFPACSSLLWPQQKASCLTSCLYANLNCLTYGVPEVQSLVSREKSRGGSTYPFGGACTDCLVAVCDFPRLTCYLLSYRKFDPLNLFTFGINIHPGWFNHKWTALNTEQNTATPVFDFRSRFRCWCSACKRGVICKTRATASRVTFYKYVGQHFQNNGITWQ